MACPERFELPTCWLEASCSAPLSYGQLSVENPGGTRCPLVWQTSALNHSATSPGLGRTTGFEPVSTGVTARGFAVKRGSPLAETERIELPRPSGHHRVQAG